MALGSTGVERELTFSNMDRQASSERSFDGTSSGASLGGPLGPLWELSGAPLASSSMPCLGLSEEPLGRSGRQGSKQAKETNTFLKRAVRSRAQRGSAQRIKRWLVSPS